MCAFVHLVPSLSISFKVNLAYDAHLPRHLDAEGLRTLPVVHGRNVSLNGSAYAGIVKEDAEVAAHVSSDANPVGMDCWSVKVDTRPPPAAAVGKFDTEGTRADAELAHFRRQHDKRLHEAYSASEVRDARQIIFQGLKAGHIRAKDAGGRRS